MKDTACISEDRSSSTLLNRDAGLETNSQGKQIVEWTEN